MDIVEYAPILKVIMTPLLAGAINIILKRAILIVFHVQKSVLIVNIITKRIRLNA